MSDIASVPSLPSSVPYPLQFPYNIISFQIILILSSCDLPNSSLLLPITPSSSNPTKSTRRLPNAFFDAIRRSTPTKAISKAALTLFVAGDFFLQFLDLGFVFHFVDEEPGSLRPYSSIEAELEVRCG